MFLNSKPEFLFQQKSGYFFFVDIIYSDNTVVKELR